MKTKRLLLSLVTMLVTAVSWADVRISSVNFPDANFRSYLTSQTYGTDGTITDSEMAEINSLMLTGKSIKNLKGIKNFTALQYLTCDGNQLTSLDLSGCTTLMELDCSDNQLTSLNVSGCTSLTSIICINNQLKDDDMDGLIENLPTIENGGLYVLNIEGDDNSMTIEQVKAASEKGWIAYAFDEDWYKYTGVTVDINETNFPDKNFRNWVLSQSYGSDSKLTDKEISGITSIKINGEEIEDLSGIEFFTSLTELRCENNKLKSLDMTKNLMLEKLDCHDNLITSLKISMLTALTELKCHGNQLSELDFSKNTNLTDLRCYENLLTVLNVAGCEKLEKIYCYSNQIKGEDMDAFIENLPTTSDGELRIFNFENEENVMLTRQAKAAKAAGWMPYYKKSSSDSWEEYAGSNLKIDEKNFPDKNFRDYLTSQSYGWDNELTEDEIENITSLYVGYENIKSLQGIKFFTALKRLSCWSNKLDTLDVSKNTTLEYLDCSSCGLASLDVSKNTALTELACNGNQLTSLDLSNNTALTSLYCYDNQLTSLDLSNNLALETLDCRENQLTSLDLSKNRALTDLDCHKNQLTSLNIGSYELEALDCSYNQLTSLSVYFSNFWTFDCSNNKLTYLWFSYSKIMFTDPKIYIYCNQLSSSAMETFINRLYIVNHVNNGTGTLDVLGPAELEGNEMTPEQASFVKGRNWIPRYYDTSDFTWKEYDGTTGIKEISADNNDGTADGKYLKDGRLVIKKGGKMYSAVGATAK